MRYILIFPICLCFAISISAEEHGINRMFKDKTYLVEATATNSNVRKLEHEELTLHTFKISHVYYGPSELKSREFYYTASSKRGIRAIGVVKPDIKLNEKGIWVLSLQAGGRLWATAVKVGGMDWPSRKNISPRYPQQKKVAEEIERISKMNAARQAIEFKKHVVGNHSELALFSLHALDNFFTEDVSLFFKKSIHSSTISLGKKLTIDHLLTGRKDVKWDKSQGRLLLYNSWVNQKIPERLYNKIIREIYYAYEYDSFSKNDAINLYRKLIQNQHTEIPNKIAIIKVISLLCKREKDMETSFNFIVEQFSKSDDPELYRNAAYYLKQCAPFSRDQVSTLNKIVIKEKGGEKATFIKEVLNYKKK